MLHDERREASEQVPFERSLQRPRAQGWAESLVDDVLVRGVVELDGPRPLPQASPRQGCRELLVEERTHLRALEGAEDHDPVDPVPELRPKRVL